MWLGLGALWLLPVVHFCWAASYYTPPPPSLKQSLSILSRGGEGSTALTHGAVSRPVKCLGWYDARGHRAHGSGFRVPPACLAPGPHCTLVAHSLPPSLPLVGHLCHMRKTVCSLSSYASPSRACCGDCRSKRKLSCAHSADQQIHSTPCGPNLVPSHDVTVAMLLKLPSLFIGLNDASVQ